ncbi:MAG: hypothetical protein LBI03_02440, partial [Clostridiales bacterium]|nr:hypothetical protein [Clostridiales bacterium]
KWSEDIIKAYNCNLENDFECWDLQEIKKGTVPASLKGKTVLKFFVREMSCSSEYNGYTYIDTLNRDATDKFIELTHEKYKEKCGNRIGTSIKGIFTDEPHRGGLMTNFSGSEWCVPWTYKIFDEFRRKYGYSIEEKLPELFLFVDGKKVSQVKWHYVDLLQDMFLDNFMKPINNWCIKNNMIFTGHVLQEDSLAAQVAMQGSLMRSYEFMGYPGVDVLTEFNKCFWIVKQLDSAARQCGKKWMLSELYGCSGWQMSFESHKAQGDWQALYGINLRCPHLSWYTMEGEAKRDYPASILHQSGWYKDYNYVETYYSRLHMLLMQGKPVCDVLYILPIESLYVGIHPGCFNNLSSNNETYKQIDKDYVNVFNWLTSNGIDFDYGDEEMMSRLASVEDETLKFGEAEYKIVLIGNMTTIRSTTLDILGKFLEKGGTVIFAGDPPEYVDALESDRAVELSEAAIKIEFNEEEIVDEIESAVGVNFEITGRKTGQRIHDIRTQLRKDKDTTYFFAFNLNNDDSYMDTNIRLYMEGNVQEWDCATGERFNIPVKKANGYIEFTVDFVPSGEHVYMISDKKTMALPEKVKLETIRKEVLTGSVEYSLNEPNVCVLDFASYTYECENKKYTGCDEILKIDREIRSISGLEYRSGSMIQPWFDRLTPKPDLGELKLTFEFEVENIPQSKIMLIVERPENYSLIAINGHEIKGFKKENWWIDESQKYVYFDPMAVLIKGKNIVELKMTFRKPKNLETIFLAGDFGVNLSGSRRIITKLADKLETSNITEQTLPFYTGCVSYHYQIPAEVPKGERLYISVPHFEGALVKIYNTSGMCKIIAWQPYEADITDLLDGSGKLDIVVSLTRRNVFGPLHELPVKGGAYGPWNYLTSGDNFTKDYALYESGLLSDPEIEYRK